MRNICGDLIKGLYDISPEDWQIDRIVQARYQSFVDVIELPDGVLSLLNKIHRHYSLALLSNYPCGKSIRDSLSKIGLLEIFDVVVVSGEVGYAKPHPKPFEVLLSSIDCSPSECLFVGDNWLADVQGAKLIGMPVIFLRQYVSYEKFEPQEGDPQPDGIIDHLKELEDLLFN